MIIDTDIKKAANRVLNEYISKNGKLTFPINPFNILRSYDCKITFSDFDKYEGVLIYKKSDSIVSINKNRRVTRQRFTAAHELGHIELHANLSEAEFLCPLSGNKSNIEKEADKFASYLLMPDDELKKLIEKYQNDLGLVDFDDCLCIAEHFGVSFEACVYAIAFRFRRLGESYNDHFDLQRMIRKYKPDKKREDLLHNTGDLTLLCSTIDYCNFQQFSISKSIGIRFFQRLIYHDSRIEKLDISYENVAGVFADLRMNEKSSVYFKSDDENIIEAMGNMKMNEYVLTTDDDITVHSLKTLNRFFCTYMPYPEYSGEYRKVDNVISGGSKQSVSYTVIYEKLDSIDDLIQNIVSNPYKFSVSEYISRVAVIHHELTLVHPFTDGNGRVIRALTNWLLIKRGICPFYIDSENRDDYLDSLKEADVSNSCDKLTQLFVKSIINTMAELHSV